MPANPQARIRLSVQFWAALSMGAALFVLSSLLYYCALQPSVADMGDGAKFQLVARVWGIPHSTGYPLYVLLGKLFTLLPLRDVAFRVNLLSALPAAVAVALLGFAIWVLTRDVWASGGAALLLAWSKTFWSQAVVPEVYALNAAFVALVILLLLLWRERGHRGYYWGAVAVYAVSLGHHATMVLLAPALLWFTWATDRKMLLQPRNVFFAGTLLALGASQYLLLYARATQHPSFCEYCPDTLPKLWWYLTGAQFRHRFFAVPWIDAVQRLTGYGTMLIDEFGIIPVAIGLLGVATLGRARRHELAFLALAFLTNVLFTAGYNIPDFANYLIPSYLLFAICIGSALAASRARIAQQGHVLKPILSTAWVCAVVGLVLWQLWDHYAIVDQSHNSTAGENAATLLRMLERDAILVLPPCCDFYDRMTSTLYAQQVEQVRPDVQFFDSPRADEPGVAYRSSLVSPTRDRLALLEPLEGTVRPAYFPQVGVPQKRALDTVYTLRGIDSSQVALDDLLNGLPEGSLVVLAARQPIAFSVDESLVQRSISTAFERLGFETVKWTGAGPHILIGVQGAEPGTAVHVSTPEPTQVELRQGQAIGTTGAAMPVALRVVSSADTARIIVNGQNVSLDHWGYNMAVLEPGSGQVIFTAYFDTETFLIDNVRVYRIVAVRQGERVLRIDPAAWKLENDRLDFNTPHVTWFLGSGWSDPEPWGTWAVGDSSSLHVSLEAGREYRMVIHATPYCPTPDSRQIMQAYWNATPLQLLTFDGCSSQTFSVRVPADQVSGSLDTITFRYGYAASPDSADSQFGDRRALAVGFETIQFEP